MSSFFSKGFKQYAKSSGSSAGFKKSSSHNFFGNQGKSFMSSNANQQANFTRL
jgi:hypothetical protein